MSNRGTSTQNFFAVLVEVDYDSDDEEINYTPSPSPPNTSSDDKAAKMVEIKEVTDEHFDMGQPGPDDDDEYSDTGKLSIFNFQSSFVPILRSSSSTRFSFPALSNFFAPSLDTLAQLEGGLLDQPMKKNA
jgi:hypothetical protein